MAAVVAGKAVFGVCREQTKLLERQLPLVVSVCALGTPEAENGRVHKLINRSAGTSCQNLTLIVKHQALLGLKKNF